MRVLVIAPRSPQPDGKGDAIRAAALVDALSVRHDVALFVPRASVIQRLLGGVVDLISGRPAQLGYTMPPAAWRRAKRAARAADVAIAITVRAIRGPLGIPTVIDHVDALSLNWARRARGPEGAARRLVAWLEARRLLRWEATVSKFAAGQLAVSRHDADVLPSRPPVRVVCHGVMFTPPHEAPREIDLVLTGNMRYPPNRHAAVWLDREIVPALWQLRPGARVVVAGRSAADLRLRHAETMSDVPSIPDVLARSRVAIVPLNGLGTGIPNKALEAAACGAALVVTPWTRDRVDLPARVASSAPGLAAEVASLLDDDEARAALAAQALAALKDTTTHRLGDLLDLALREAASTASESASADGGQGGSEA